MTDDRISSTKHHQKRTIVEDNRVFFRGPVALDKCTWSTGQKYRWNGNCSTPRLQSFMSVIFSAPLQHAKCAGDWPVSSERNKAQHDLLILLKYPMVVVNHGWQSEATDGSKGDWCLLSFSLSLSLTIYLPTYLSTYVSIDLSIYLSVYLCIYLSIDPSIHLSIYLSIYLSIHLSTHLSIYPSTYPIYLSISLFHLSICLAVCPVYLSIYLSVYLSTCLSVVQCHSV